MNPDNASWRATLTGHSDQDNGYFSYHEPCEQRHSKDVSNDWDETFWDATQEERIQDYYQPNAEEKDGGCKNTLNGEVANQNAERRN
jgi:predicted RNA-binding protein with PUA-like domain